MTAPAAEPGHVHYYRTAIDGRWVCVDCGEPRGGPAVAPRYDADRIDRMAAAAHAAAWGRLYAPLVARAGARGQVVTMPAWETEPDDSRALWRHVVASALVAGELV